jgi:phosphatidylglycerol---prolipoprotein diacylglyceryl transferase
VLAAIPYTTFPSIDLGPLSLRTFGLMVALGVLLGAWVAASYAERFGISRDETYRVATWMVLAGIVGARLTWAATHTDQIDSPIDVIAIWEGGIQFSGGFIFAVVVGLPFFRRWTRLQRWHVLDAYALGLTLGLAVGRVGCYAVGEHFGRVSDFFLATRYDGGDVREPTLGDTPLTVGTTFHNTALYELI